jgi:hypothetical protein
MPRMVCLVIPLCAGVLLLAIVWLIALPNRLPSGLCTGCAYSLSGLGESGDCPECGTRFDKHVRTDRVPAWGSKTEHALLLLMPIAFGLLSAAASIVGSPSVPNTRLLILLAAKSGLIAIAPAFVLTLTTLRLLGRSSAWGIGFAAALAGAAVAATLFIAAMSVNAIKVALFTPYVGALASAFVGGVAGCLAAAHAQLKLRRFKVRPAESTSANRPRS